MDVAMSLRDVDLRVKYIYSTYSEKNNNFFSSFILINYMN